jgi:hypothetical protein
MMAVVLSAKVLVLANEWSPRDFLTASEWVGSPFRVYRE